MYHYTSVEQGKKLVELGLSRDTADMYYEFNFITEKNLQIPKVVNGSLHDTSLRNIPCWSVGALLNLMPPYLFEWERGIDLNIYRNLNGKGWHVSYMPNNIEDMKKDKFRQIANGDTQIEAAYNMMVWLLENDYIRKGE